MMAEFALGFAACWMVGTLAMWRRTAAVSSDSPLVRFGFALAWPLMLWMEGR